LFGQLRLVYLGDGGNHEIIALFDDFAQRGFGLVLALLFDLLLVLPNGLGLPVIPSNNP